MKVKTSKGFTLAELLIVMAIIVVLAAVAIPTFGKQLETARETGDMEIIRNAYEEALSIATLDGADGKFNGKFGNGSPDLVSDDLANCKWGAVSIAAVADVTKSTSATVTHKCKYTVTLNSTDTAVTTMGARFAQAKDASLDTSAKAWKYVNPVLMGCTVPVVDSTKTKLTFQFEITADGDIQLVKDATDKPGVALAILAA